MDLKEAMEAARLDLDEATARMESIRAAQEAWLESRTVDLLGDPAFEGAGSGKPAAWVKRLVPGCGKALSFRLIKADATKQAKKELVQMYLSKEVCRLVLG